MMPPSIIEVRANLLNLMLYDITSSIYASPGIDGCIPRIHLYT